MELCLTVSLLFSFVLSSSSFVLIRDRHEIQFPFQDTSLPIKDRVKVSIPSVYNIFLLPLKDIVDKLTLKELVEQMAHGGASSNGRRSVHVSPVHGFLNDN